MTNSNERHRRRRLVTFTHTLAGVTGTTMLFHVLAKTWPVEVTQQIRRADLHFEVAREPAIMGQLNDYLPIASSDGNLGHRDSRLVLGQVNEVQPPPTEDPVL